MLKPLSLPSHFHPCIGKHGWILGCHTLNFLHVTPLYVLCMSNVDCTVKYRSRPPTRITDNKSPSSLLPFSSEGNFCLYWWEQELDTLPFSLYIFSPKMSGTVPHPPPQRTWAAITTEYTQSGNGRFLAYISSRWKISPGWWGWRRCTPAPFHFIYHHVQSCSVRSSWVGKYTHPISSLPIHVLCGNIYLSPFPCPLFLLSGGNTFMVQYRIRAKEGNSHFSITDISAQITPLTLSCLSS